MNNYHEMYKTICRVCLLQNNCENMVSLTENSSDNGLSCFGKSILILTNVSIQNSDKLPNMMCQNCVYLLKQAIYFKLKCESSDQKLKLLVKNGLSEDGSEQNIKETVCQYVMFNRYFPPEMNTTRLQTNNKRKFGIKPHSICQEIGVRSKIDKTDAAIPKEDFPDDSEEDSDTRDNNYGTINSETDTILQEIQKLQKHIDMDSILPRHKGTKYKPKLAVRRKNDYPRDRSKQRNFICNICHRILANRLTYDHHMQRHNNCRYICEQCGKGFPVLAEMHIHQIARHGIGPYLKCDHCSYKAPRKLQLIEHLRIHTGERPFTCEKCGLTFRRKAIWRSHLICHTEKTYQCAYCPMKFFRKGPLVVHCNNVHERMYMFMCHVCKVTYTKTETVRRHMTLKHGIPREKQGRIVKITNGSNRAPTIET